MAELPLELGMRMAASGGRHARIEAVGRLLSFIEDYAQDHPEHDVKLEFGYVRELAPIDPGGVGWAASICVHGTGDDGEDAVIAFECGYAPDPLLAVQGAIECTIAKLAEHAGTQAAKADLARLGDAVEDLDRASKKRG